VIQPRDYLNYTPLVTVSVCQLEVFISECFYMPILIVVKKLVCVDADA